MKKKRTKHAAGKKRRWRRRGPLGFSIPGAGSMIGLGRDASYAAADKGEIPTVEIGCLRIVPAVPWLRKLGIDKIDAIIGELIAELAVRGADQPNTENGKSAEEVRSEPAGEARTAESVATRTTPPAKAKTGGRRAPA